MTTGLTRRDFCKLFATSAAGAASGVLWPGLLSAANAPARRGDKLNVLFIAVDDLRPQLGCYGHDEVKSPNIDRLADEGVVFERAYCQEAICAPSRASVLTGCRPDTTRVYWLSTPVRQTMPKILTLPEHFLRNGYRSVSLGKVYHHPGEDPQGWCVEQPRPRGAWKGRGYLSEEAVAQLQANDARLAAEGRKSRGAGPAFEAPDAPDNAYPDGMVADAAIAELQRAAKEDRPFFLATGFLKPHLPFNAPKRYWDLYDPAAFALPEALRPPEGVTPYSLTDWGELRQYLNIPDAGPVAPELTRKLVHAYCACVSYVDAQIGRVLAALDRLGLRENTVVMLWGDHGWKLGEYGAWSKHTNFERTPARR